MAKTRKDFNRFEASVRLTKDARYVAPTNQEGTNAKLYFTGACNAGYQTADGKDVVRYIEFAMNGKLATAMKEYLKKGTALEIRNAEFNTWQTQEDGKYLTHYIFNVLDFNFAQGGKKDGTTSTGAENEPVIEVASEPEVQEEVVGIEISDNDLPF